MLVLLLVLVLDLLAIRAEKRSDLSATVLFWPAWQGSGCFLDYEHEHKHEHEHEFYISIARPVRMLSSAASTIRRLLTASRI